MATWKRKRWCLKRQGLSQQKRLQRPERATHSMTHLPFQPWCELCVAGKSKEDPHRRRANGDIGVEKTPVIQIDYLFLGRNAAVVEEESSLFTMLVAIDVPSRFPGRAWSTASMCSTT